MRSRRENASKFLRLLIQRRSTYPREIQVEVTNACNLKCAMCPHTHGLVPQEDFSVALFEHLLTHNPAPHRLVLTGWGEPLMHKQFFDLVEMTNRYWPSTQVRFTTNGILLSEERRRRIADLRIAGITVSVDLWPEREALPPAWRKILHPPSPQIFRNLVAYCEEGLLHSRTPLTLQSLLVQENFEDVREYISFAAEHSMEALNLVRMQAYPDNPAQRPAWLDEQAMIAELVRWGKERGVEVRSVNRQPFALRLATHFDRICMRTDDSVYITVDGTVTPCCNLREYAIGSLSASGMDLSAAWNSPAEIEFFADQSSVCGKCDALFHLYKEAGNDEPPG